ncbi:MAG: hypothetical protein ACRDZ5_12240, partial [Acidimicrobiales bacterium]
MRPQFAMVTTAVVLIVSLTATRAVSSVASVSHFAPAANGLSTEAASWTGPTYVDGNTLDSVSYGTT